MDIVVTIDVEGHRGEYQSVVSTDSMLASMSIPATLFVTPDVVRNRPETVQRWIDGRHTVGLHIHPERLSGGESNWLTKYETNAIEKFLVDGLQTFADILGETPAAFRAGRWEYSDELMQALASQGFERDASLKSDTYVESYTSHGVAEYPMSTYTNPIVRILLAPWTISSIPIHADSFLSNSLTTVGFYFVTHRLLRTDRPYLMVSYHDYDILNATVRERIRTYVEHVAQRGVPKTVEQLDVPDRTHRRGDTALK